MCTALRRVKRFGLNLLPFNVADAASIALILRILSTELFKKKNYLAFSHSVCSLSQQTEWEVLAFFLFSIIATTVRNNNIDQAHI